MNRKLEPRRKKKKKKKKKKNKNENQKKKKRKRKRYVQNTKQHTSIRFIHQVFRPKPLAGCLMSAGAYPGGGLGLQGIWGGETRDMFMCWKKRGEAGGKHRCEERKVGKGNTSMGCEIVFICYII